MNNKGFTLIELIIVIAILTMFSLFTAPNIIKIIDKNKADNHNSLIDSIIESTKLYVTNNKDKFNYKDSSGNNSYCTITDTKDIYTTITLKTLIDNKEISNINENPCTNNTITPEKINIKIILDCETRNFSYQLIDTGNNFKTNANGEILKIQDGKTCTDIYD